MSWYIVEVRSVEHYLVKGENPMNIVKETMFSDDWDEMEVVEVVPDSEVPYYKTLYPKDKILEL